MSFESKIEKISILLLGFAFTLNYFRTANDNSIHIEKSDLIDDDCLEEKEEFLVNLPYSEESDDDPLQENFKKRKRRREFEVEDDVDVFFSGLAKIVKKLPSTTQAKLKLQCSNLIINAELKYEEERQRRSASPEYVSVYKVSPNS